MRSKKLNVDDLVGGLGAKQGERITDTFNKSLLNTEQLIKVSLNKIYVSKQIRLKIHQDKVDEIAASYPLRNYPEIRKVDPEIDGDNVPDGFDYVLLTGEHRFHALVKLNLSEHDFKFVPPSLIKTKADVIKYQFVENNIRADMHFIEKAKSLIDYMDAAQCTKGEAGQVLGITNSVVSRLLRVAKYFTEKDNQFVLDHNINSERVLVGISKLIEMGHSDWLSKIKPYAQNADGEFDPELIYESTLTRIIKDLTEPAEPKQEAVKPSAKPQAEGISPNAFKENVTSENESGSETAIHSGSSDLKSANSSVKPESHGNQGEISEEKESLQSPKDNESSNIDGTVKVKETVQTPPSPSIVSPSIDSDKKHSSFKLAANVLQQVLDGKEIEEILIELGPDIKKYVSEEDGADIYAMIQALPFSN